MLMTLDVGSQQIRAKLHRYSKNKPLNHYILLGKSFLNHKKPVDEKKVNSTASNQFYYFLRDSPTYYRGR